MNKTLKSVLELSITQSINLFQTLTNTTMHPRIRTKQNSLKDRMRQVLFSYLEVKPYPKDISGCDLFMCQKVKEQLMGQATWFSPLRLTHILNCYFNLRYEPKDNKLIF